MAGSSPSIQIFSGLTPCRTKQCAFLPFPRPHCGPVPAAEHGWAHIIIVPLLCPFPFRQPGPLKSLLTLVMPFPSTLAPRHSSACQPSATADLTRHALGSSSQGLTAPVALTTLHRRKLKPRGLTCKVAKQEGGRHPTVCASTNTALWITSALPSCSTATTTTYILYCYETCLVSSPGSSLPRAHRRAEPES